MLNKKIIIFTCLGFLSLICLAALLLSYWQLDRIPYGFHVDELAGSVTIGCLTTEGVDAHNVAYPVFSNVNYGTPKPPTYIYPGIVWGKAFGYSVASLRALSVTVHYAYGGCAMHGIAMYSFDCITLVNFNFIILTSWLFFIQIVE